MTTLGSSQTDLRWPVVRVLPLQPHCFAFGGFELQMIGAMDSVRSRGLDIRPLDWWSKDDDFDIIHCWGLSAQHENAINWARTAKKKVVISVLVGYPSWTALLRRRLSEAAGLNRWRKRILNLVDAVTVVNQDQADFVCQFGGVAPERVFVIPNIVRESFLNYPKMESRPPSHLAGYILTTGNLCSRKNQLSLVMACRDLGVPLLIIGDVLTGETDYGEAVAREVATSQNIRWIKSLPAGSGELISAYANAKIFALPSYEETQPISALEAVAMEIPILLADRPYARQTYFYKAGLVNPNSVKSISAVLAQMIEQPTLFRDPAIVLDPFRATSVGAAYAAVYKTILS